jgi:hypothetical protein
MSGAGFHVHGPHDHAVEHAAHTSDNFSNRVAVLTATLATVGALFGYLGGHTQNEAALFKNNAAIKKTEASNQWNYYQAKSSKQNLAELAIALGSDPEKYKDAEKLEASSREWEQRSDEAMHQHHRWALATTAEQIAISLAAITLLTRKKWLEYGSYGVALAGVGLGVLAALHI